MIVIMTVIMIVILPSQVGDEVNPKPGIRSSYPRHAIAAPV